MGVEQTLGERASDEHIVYVTKALSCEVVGLLLALKKRFYETYEQMSSRFVDGGVSSCRNPRISSKKFCRGCTVFWVSNPRLDCNIF